MNCGPSFDPIKTTPEFARTRETMNELGGCATARLLQQIQLEFSA